MNWRQMNQRLPDLSESELYELIQAERTGARRKTVLLRLHQRYCALRDARERYCVLLDARERQETMGDGDAA
jgi:hypothetical protein